MKISFLVEGIPQPAGSKRAFPFEKADGKLGVAVSDDNPKAADWKTTVGWNAIKARNAAGRHGKLFDGPLRLTLVYEVPRPRSHIGSDGLPRRSAPRLPTGKPDLLKLARAVEDALKWTIYRDDSLIVDEHLKKRWGATAVLHVTVETIEEGEPP